MPITYTNRKGVTYYLCQGLTKAGKPRYYFAGSPRETPVEELPEGFRISESANGVVTLGRERPSPFLPEEIAAVEAASAGCLRPGDYHIAVKQDQIVISGPADLGRDGNLPAGMAESLGMPLEHLRVIYASFKRTRNFRPLLRFLLADTERRIFLAQRWRTLGSTDRWIEVGPEGPLAQIAGPAVSRLGDDAFYELF